MQKWPFMLTANRWLDYRIVLLPEFIKNAAQLDALVSVANRCSEDEGPSDGFKRMDSPELGRLIVWYEKLVAKIDGKDLLDHVGRPIFRVQGIIFRNYSNESDVAHLIDPELAQRMRTKADVAFADFGKSRSPIAPVIAVDLATGPKGAHEKNEIEVRSRSSVIHSLIDKFPFLLPLAAGIFILGALGLYAVNRLAQTEMDVGTFKVSMETTTKSERDELQQLKGSMEEYTKSERNELQRLKNLIGDLQADNTLLKENLQKCNIKVDGILQQLDRQ